MDCRQIRSRFIGWVDGDLPRQQAALVAGHLEACAACRDALEDLRAFDALCEQHLPAPSPAYTTQALLARLKEVDVLSEVTPLLPGLPVRQSASRLAAAAMVLALAGNLQQSASALKTAASFQQNVIQARQDKLKEELIEGGLPIDLESRSVQGLDQA